MLPARRRYFALLGLLLMATPLVAGLVRPDAPESIRKEAREPAPAPAAPQTLEAALALPKEVDAYLKDHFGLREKMIRLHKDFAKPVVLQENPVVVYGKSGRMYALADDMVLQSAGQVVRTQKVMEAADLISAMRDALALRGVKFLVAAPPNSSTIYPDDLPKWAQNPGKATEYDLLIKELAARGVKAVDLRPALSLARLDGPTYLLNDLHWTAPGAVAAFNAVAEAAGHPDWRIAPSAAIGSPVIRKGGDIARLLGVDDSVSETTESFNLRPIGTNVHLTEGEMPEYVLTTGRNGPTVMVIGDSFTTGYFPIMLSQSAGRAIWIHHRHCGFDWAWIDKLRPDEVWWTPVERFLVCWPGQSPKNFGAVAARGDQARNSD